MESPPIPSVQPPGPYAIELVGIDKQFGPVHANRAIDMTVPEGSIYGLVGENGAGKSTLMSILYGFYRADKGSIRIRGKEVDIDNPRDALGVGIGMVFQHLKLVGNMSVLDNVMLGNEGGFALAGGRAAARALLTRLSEEHGLSVDPDAIVQDLPIGIQQRVEILKLLYRQVDILILDEPTDVLTPQETDQLFEILEDLRKRGVTIILITHKLKEILAVTDWVTVIRRGAVVGTRPTSETSEAELAELMVGRKISFSIEKPAQVLGETRLEVQNLSLAGEGRKALDEVGFEIRAGEIVGVAGISGNGQTELLQVLAGMRAFDAGSVRLGDQQLKPGQGQQMAGAMRDLGLAHVPEDRLRHGQVSSFTAAQNSMLGRQQDSRFVGLLGNLKHASIEAYCRDLITRFDVRPPNPHLSSQSFSGGNQQKLVLAREMTEASSVLLVGQPTRGVDVGAIEFIHDRLIEMRSAGLAILLVSGELDEILKLSDRILVMFEGRIVGELPGEGADEREIGLLMAGSKPEELAA